MYIVQCWFFKKFQLLLRLVCAPKYTVSYLVKSDLLLQIMWIFRVILHPPPSPQKKKKKTESIICHDNVMSYGAGYLSHNFCSIVRGRLAVLLPNDFVAICCCKITVDLNLPEFPCINSHQSVTGNLHQRHLTVLAAKRWDLQYNIHNIGTKCYQKSQ